MPLMQDISIFALHCHRTTQRSCHATTTNHIVERSCELHLHLAPVSRCNSCLNLAVTLGSSLLSAFPLPQTSTLALSQTLRETEIVPSLLLQVKIFPSTGVPCTVDIVRNQECRTSYVLLGLIVVLLVQD